jgi:hypothetical protein
MIANDYTFILLKKVSTSRCVCDSDEVIEANGHLHYSQSQGNYE